MENWETYIDDKGIKWIWINEAFYIDDMTIEEAREKILNLTREDVEIINKIWWIIWKA